MKRQISIAAENADQVFIHPLAIVESNRIGDGTRIWAFAHVLKDAVIGLNCNVADGTFIEGGAQIGDNVTIKNQCLIWEGVTIGDNVIIGANAVVTHDIPPNAIAVGIPAKVIRTRDPG